MLFTGDCRVDIAQVEAVDLRINLKRNAVGRRRAHNRREIEWIGLALEKKTAGEVTDDVDIRVIDDRRIRLVIC